MWIVLVIMVIVAVIVKACQAAGVEERANKKLEELAKKEKEKQQNENQ